MSRTSRDRWRWRVASAMDRLPRTCWANLVSYALRSRRSPLQFQDDVCRADAARNGTCYCGGITRRTGDAA